MAVSINHPSSAIALTAERACDGYCCCAIAIHVAPDRDGGYTLPAVIFELDGSTCEEGAAILSLGVTTGLAYEIWHDLGAELRRRAGHLLNH